MLIALNVNIKLLLLICHGIFSVYTLYSFIKKVSLNVGIYRRIGIAEPYTIKLKRE